MTFAANFIAIDFETANRRPDSACQLAAVVVRDGVISDSKMWMIRPEPFYFSPFNIEVHGIVPDDVEHEGNFADQWDSMAAFLGLGAKGPGQRCLVAHNAAFDIGVLSACLKSHRLAVPDLDYTCTRSIARQTWPKRPRFGLKPLSDWLGVEFRHHDALEDSIACAKILLAAGIARQVSTLEQLEQSLKLSRGTAGPWGKKGPAKLRSPRKMKPPPTASQPSEDESSGLQSLLDLQRLLVRAEFIRPLSGQTIVFTGHLASLDRQDAEQLASRLGGLCQNKVTKETDMLVVGNRAPQTAVAGRTLSVKEETANAYQAAGGPIRIVTEQEFLGYIVANAER
ncbi:exonuclease domain-containing protein [Novipirellula artificiosorum]|uniref:DNA polymerase III subunit epsilon n=1 Tax=Novipirellula artificiosorum TaxID=2528016 RepID=A0A5C6DDU6_9BACT|nr:exonuclease domain-containing protein [Novipirellula artificiosorum]TWU34355.1 DNA polymerase III subunit epsilon [Novipirellula artificiosorum]